MGGRGRGVKLEKGMGCLGASVAKKRRNIKAPEAPEEQEEAIAEAAWGIVVEPRGAGRDGQEGLEQCLSPQAPEGT